MDELKRARALAKAIDVAAEAAHDRFYEIGPGLSDLGYAFADERTKRAWRDVVAEVLQAIGGAP